MGRTESCLILICILYVTFCSADEASLCATGKYQIIPKSSDCVGYYFCLYGKAIDMPPCVNGAVFSRKYHVCVRKGGIHDDCTAELEKPLTIEQQCENGASIIPHPSECQLYYNCSLRYEYVPRHFEQHMEECTYPQFFSTKTEKCEDFEKVDCGKRMETTDGCDYRRNQCGTAHCIPCRVRIPSCANKPDGIHAHDDKPWSPYYVTCYKQRSVSQDVCSRDINGRTQLFHMDLKECVPLDMVPQKFGGTMPNCEGREDGNYLDDVGRCNQFTVCKSGRIESIVKCEEGQVFDPLKGECWQYEKACGPCGGMNNW